MQLLSAVYESARINIPAKLFAERAAVRPWPDLDEQVRSELIELARKIESAVGLDDMCLAKHRRVIGEFNRGVREGFFSPGNDDGRELSMTRGPYKWGHDIGRHALLGGKTTPETAKQFITATHLLGYEFGQLDLARTGVFDFILRNVGPQRADELGELAFALPVLINYQRTLVQEILASEGFSLVDYHARQSPAPTHLEYLTHGIVALFDPAPESWVRVAANMALAAMPFSDGTTLRGEDYQAPEHAAEVVFRAPIAARTAVRRQMDRVLLAREWLSASEYGIQMDGERASPVTLWNVYQSTPASRIRGKESYFGDVVASSMIYLVSRYFESVIPAEQTGFQFLRRHFNAFARGFDSRVEGVVDPRALASAARGRLMSEGLRRFGDGGYYIGQVSADLQELGAAINELHHALDNPVEFVMEQLVGNQESELSVHLHELFRKYPNLPRELFAEDADFELFSKTHVKTRSAYDLIRSALYLVTRAVAPTLNSSDEASLLLARSREALDRIRRVESEPPAPRDEGRVRSGPIVAGPPDTEEGANADDDLIVAAQLFDAEFEILVRIMRALIHRLHNARVLGKPQSLFQSDGAGESPFSPRSTAGTR